MLPALIAMMSISHFQTAKPPAYIPSPIVLKAPIERWDEGIPLGNGMIGVLVWGGGNKINLSLDRGDLWDLRTPDTLKEPGWTYANMQKLVREKNQAELVRLFDAPYEEFPYPTKLPAGRLEIEFGGAKIKEFVLDLNHGVAFAHRDGISFEVFASATDSTVVVSAPPDARVRLLPPAGVKTLGYPKAVETRTDEEASFVQTAAGGLRYCVLARSALDSDPRLRTIAISVTTSNESKDVVGLAKKRTLEAEKHWALRLRSQFDWWRKFWQTSSLQIPDERLQRHYDFVKYLYGAGSRKGAPPMPLQGVWTADEGGLPPWKGDYHNDLNTQMTYLAYHEAGLTEAGEAWLDFLWKLLPEFKKFAKSFYGVEGAVVPGVMTLDGKPMGGWGMYSLSPTNGAWVAQSFYLHWRYTMDRKFLKERAYPFCKEIATALKGLLKPDAGGLKLPLSSSPEIHDNSLAAWLTPNSNYDTALLQALFLSLTSMARDLRLDRDFKDWYEVLRGLPEIGVDPKTQSLIVAKGQTFDQSHRHFSHAMAIYPLGTLPIDAVAGNGFPPGVVAANTIDGILKQGTKWWCGYSFSWMACMLARAGRGEEALKYLKDSERAFTLRNGFHANGDQTKSGLSNFTYRPFTLEGNFLAMQAVQEMLMQSWGNLVRVFPAVSKEWQDCEFHDLRAEGGWKVSAKRQHGLTVWVKVEFSPVGRTLQSVETSTLRIRDPFEGRIPSWNRKDVKLDGPDYVVKLKKGQVLEGRASPEDP